MRLEILFVSRCLLDASDLSSFSGGVKTIIGPVPLLPIVAIGHTASCCSSDESDRNATIKSDDDRVASIKSDVERNNFNTSLLLLLTSSSENGAMVLVEVYRSTLSFSDDCAVKLSSPCFLMKDRHSKSYPIASKSLPKASAAAAAAATASFAISSSLLDWFCFVCDLTFTSSS